MGLVVGVAGYVGLAPADSSAAGASEAGGSGVTVTTSPGAGGTEGEAAAAGQAATPEEQVIFDLAEAFTNEDCAAINELVEISFWGGMFEVSSLEEDEALTRCEDGFSTGELGPVRVFTTSILQTNQGGGTDVAFQASGWREFNSAQVREVDGVWKVFYISYDPAVNQENSGAAELDVYGEGDESGGGELDSPSGRPVVDPEEPPTGNETFDELAQNCHGGSMVACDDLYWVAPRGSDYELYGITCGGRRLGVFAGGFCERDFNREVGD